MRAQQPLGVQITGVATFETVDALRARLMETLIDAGFELRQLSVDTPGWTWSIVSGQLLRYRFVARIVVKSWTNDPTDTTAGMLAAFTNVGIPVLMVTTFDVTSGQDTSAPAAVETSVWTTVGTVASAINTDLKWVLVVAVIGVVAIAYTRPQITI